MDKQPKPEPGSAPIYAPTIHRNLEDMNTSELIWGLCTKFLIEDYEQVEKILVARESNFQAEIGKLHDQVAIDRLLRVKAEKDFNDREQQCQRGKRAQQSLEILMKRVKTGELVDVSTVHDLRNKVSELKSQICKMKELEQNRKSDSGVVAEITVRNRELEEAAKKNEESLERLRGRNLELELENVKMKEKVKKLVDESNAVTEIKTRNAKLEEEMKKNEKILDMLTERNLDLEVENGNMKEKEKKWLDESKVVADLRGRICDLEDEKNKNERLIESMERKFEELNERVVKMDEDVKLLMSTEDEPLVEPVATANVNDEEDVRDYEFGNETSLGASRSGKGKSKFENVEIIHLDDDDDDKSTSWGSHGKKATAQIVPKNESSSPVQQENISAKAQTIEMLKRKISFSGMDTSSSDSSSSSDDDHLPISFLGLSGNKKPKT